jgi:hypothetical protein
MDMEKTPKQRYKEETAPYRAGSTVSVFLLD